MGSLEARRVAEGDRTSFWQAVIVDLFFGGSAWWDSACRAASLQAGIDACGTRGDFERRLRTRTPGRELVVQNVVNWRTVRGYGELWRGSSDWIGRPSR